MAFNRKDGGSNVAATPKRRSGSAWVTATKVDRRLSGAWVRVWNSYSAISSVTASATAVSGGPGSGAGTVTSNTTTVTASGGTGSYTYSWSRLSGDTSTTCGSPTARSTSFSTYFSNATATRTSVWRCTVSDGVSSGYVDVTVNLYNNRSTGGVEA